MTVEERIRKRRMDAQMRVTADNVQERLDLFREALRDAMVAFEADLDAALESVPVWDVIPEDVEEAFTVELGARPTRVGPRTAAVVASSVESFFLRWLDPERADLPAEVPPELAQQFGADFAAVEGDLDAVEDAVRQAATEAERGLSGKLDDLLGDLEDEREAQEAALRKRVAAGEVEAGPAHRKEEARLWEEQRDKAAALRDAWEPLEQFSFRGVEETIAAIAELRGIFDETVRAVIDVHPELRSHAGPRFAPRGKRIWRVQRPEPVRGARAPGTPSSEVDDARRITEPMEPTQTHEYTRESPAEPRTARVESRWTSDVRATQQVVSRNREGWEPVRLAELALLVGPPVGYFLFLGGAAIVFRYGGGPYNPFHRWPWAMPVFAVLALYCVIMPLFMRWRVRWDGLRPVVVRHEIVTEREVMRVDDTSVRIGDLRIDFDDATFKLRRGESMDREPIWLLEMRVGRVTVDLRARVAKGEYATSSAPFDIVDDTEQWLVSESLLLGIASRYGALR